MKQLGLYALEGLTLKEKAESLSKSENELDIVFDVKTSLKIFYAANENDEYNLISFGFRFQDDKLANENMMDLANYLNEKIMKQPDIFCSLDEKLTNILNGYIKSITSSKVHIDSFSEDAVELITNYTSADFNTVYLTMFNYLKPAFNSSVDGIEQYVVTPTQETLCLTTITAVAYLNKLSSKLLFANRTEDEYSIYDVDSDIYKMLNTIYNSSKTFTTTKRATLIVDRAYSNRRVFELFKKTDNSFFITIPSDM